MWKGQENKMKSIFIQFENKYLNDEPFSVSIFSWRCRFIKIEQKNVSKTV